MREHEKKTGGSNSAGRKGPHHLLVITYWSFNDALVQTYTLPYLNIIQKNLPAGSVIHLVTLEKGTGPLTPEQMTTGVEHHPFRYHPLGARGALGILQLVWRLARLMRSRSIGTVHAWCTPAGMIGYLVSVLTRRPLVIDSYEPHAEAMVENGTWSKGGIAFRTLFLFERLQSKRATALIAAAAGMKEYAQKKYGVHGTPFFVKPACVDLERFDSSHLKEPELLRSLGMKDKVVGVYAGKFGGIYWFEEVFSFFRVARDHWGDRFHALLLTPHTREELEPYFHKHGLPSGMFTIRFVQHASIPSYMGLGDFALTPVKPVPTKRYCTPIKDGEYWALGLPVVITAGISDDSELIERYGIGAVLQGSRVEDLEHAVGTIDRLLAGNTPEERYAMIRPIAEKYRTFAIAEEVYASVYGNGE